MKAYVMFESKTGNTKMLADLIRKYYRDRDETALSLQEADVVFVGSWTNEGHMSDAMATKLRRCQGKKVFLFGTCGFGNEDYYASIVERNKAALAPNTELVGTFYCQGKMPETVRTKYEDLLKETPNDPKLEFALINYEKALTHPDQTDLDNLAAVLDELGKKFA